MPLGIADEFVDHLHRIVDHDADARAEQAAHQVPDLPVRRAVQVAGDTGGVETTGHVLPLDRHLPHAPLSGKGDR
jgi:hypothetical protein